MDSRIGTLVRNGSTVFYVTLEGRHVEGDLAEVLFHLSVADRYHAEGRRMDEQADERADAAERAYNAALEQGGSQGDWDAAAEAAYDECALRQRQAAEQAYQDNHR